MGRVVKGARIAQQTYQVKAPALPPPAPVLPASNDYSGAVDGPPILPHAEIDVESVRARTQEMLDQARAQADDIVAEGRRLALCIVDQAQQGVAEIESNAKTIGFDQGRSDGRAAAQAEMDEMLQTMRGLIEMARVERHKIIESAEPEIVRLSVAIAERILSAHIAVQPQTVIDMVRSAITRLVNRETVTVRVNPGDIEIMRAHREDLMTMNDIDNLRLIEDQRVDRGGVLIDTDAGTIDAKVSTQLREVRRLLAVEDPLTLAPSSAEPTLLPSAAAS